MSKYNENSEKRLQWIEKCVKAEYVKAQEIPEYKVFLEAKFKENLKHIRRKQNITQEQLADMLSVSRQAIGKWESGNGYPETEKLILLAKELNVSLDYLFSERCRMVRPKDKERISKIDTYLNCARYSHIEALV